MLKWNDILEFANEGTPEPDRRLEKTEDEWQAQLTPEQFRVTRLHGTEPAFSSEMCHLLEPGKYTCVCCDTLLFDATEKFESATGWPSFTQPVKENVIAYLKDDSLEVGRVETICNVCDAHLGHVFPDGPEPSGLRYCMNAVALRKIDSSEKLATFGGGCFWCTEAIFQHLKGVISVESGYSGGSVPNPTYSKVCNGETGHAEVVQVTYDSDDISYEEIVRVHLGTHNPTTPDRQGSDVGSQYRSIILVRDEEEKQTAHDVIEEFEGALEGDVVTEVTDFEAFYPAEEHHRNYYSENPKRAYCENIIEPKLQKFRGTFEHLLAS